LAPPLTKAQREKLLLQQTAKNRIALVDTLLTARGHVEERILKAASNKKFATVRRIREGIYKDIQSEYVALQGNLDVWTRKSILDTSKVYHGLSASDMLLMDDDKSVISFTKFSRAHLDDYFERVSAFNADKLAAVNVQLNPQLTRMLETDVKALRKGVVESLREAQVAGMTPPERWTLLQGKVLEYADNPQSWAFIDKSGKKWARGGYFNMLNRTVTAQTARNSYNDTLTGEGRDLVQIVGGTSDDSHDACIEWDGQVVSLSGNSSDYPALDEYTSVGGFHPNCVHQTVYVSAEFEPTAKILAEQKGKPAPVVKKPTPKPKESVKSTDSPTG